MGLHKPRKRTKAQKLQAQVSELKASLKFAWSVAHNNKAKYDDLRVKLYQYDRLGKDLFRG